MQFKTRVKITMPAAEEIEIRLFEKQNKGKIPHEPDH